MIVAIRGSKCQTYQVKVRAAWMQFSYRGNKIGNGGALSKADLCLRSIVEPNLQSIDGEMARNSAFKIKDEKLIPSLFFHRLLALEKMGRKISLRGGI